MNLNLISVVFMLYYINLCKESEIGAVVCNDLSDLLVQDSNGFLLLFCCFEYGMSSSADPFVFTLLCSYSKTVCQRVSTGHSRSIALHHRLVFLFTSCVNSSFL